MHSRRFIRAAKRQESSPQPPQGALSFAEPRLANGVIRPAEMMRKAHQLLEPMPHWKVPSKPVNAPADMTWLTSFRVPPKGWAPSCDAHGYTPTGWEWRICDQPFSALLNCLAARIGDRSRHAEVADQDAGMAWVEALPA